MTTAETPRAEVRLDLEGMTCASCVARIERKLNKLDGVTATVNYATEKAAVEYDPEVVRPEALVEAVEQVAGVSSVEVDLDAKAVVVRGEDLGDEVVRAAIEEAGYDVVA